MAGLPSSGCGGHRDRAFLIHRCDIEKPGVSVVTSTIRDRQFGFTVIDTNIPCWFEDMGRAVADHNEQVGRVPIGRFTVWFEGGVEVNVGYRLKKSGVYYVVEEVRSFADEGFGKTASVREMGYAAQ